MKNSWLLVLPVIVVAAVAVFTLPLQGPDALKMFQVKDSKRVTGASVLSAASSPAADDLSSSPTQFPEGECDSSLGTVAREEDEGKEGHKQWAPAKPGRLKFSVFDAVTDQKVHSTTVRLMNDHRFAETSTGADVDVWLSGGSYQAMVMSPGYEPFMIEDVSVPPEQCTDLGAVLLSPGMSFIHGVLEARQVPPGTEMTLQLLGTGRRPCERCTEQRVEQDIQTGGETMSYEATSTAPGDVAESGSEEAARSEPMNEAERLSEQAAGVQDEIPNAIPEVVMIDPWQREESCAFCGFTARGTLRKLKDGERFTFPGLASGRYLLRAHEPSLDPIGALLVIDLESWSGYWAHLSMPGSCTAELFLVDELGHTFDGTWKQGEESHAAEVRFVFYRGDCEIASIEFPPSVRDFGSRVHLGHTLFLNAQWRNIEFTFAEDIVFVEGIGSGVGAAPCTAIDRDKTDTDILLPDPQAPSVDAVALSGEALEPGRFKVLSLPCEDLSFEVHCGPFASGRRPLPLMYRREHRQSVVMKKQEGSADIDSGEFTIALDLSSGIQDLILTNIGARHQFRFAGNGMFHEVPDEQPLPAEEGR